MNALATLRHDLAVAQAAATPPALPVVLTSVAAVREAIAAIEIAEALVAEAAEAGEPNWIAGIYTMALTALAVSGHPDLVLRDRLVAARDSARNFPVSETTTKSP